MRVYEARLEFTLVREGPCELLNSPEKVASYMEGAFDDDPTIEWFYVVAVNRKNIPISRIVITRGTATSSLVHPREVFRAVILAGASGLITVHNHPSGDPNPSSADIQVTRQLRDAGKTLGIELLDHVILGEPGGPSEKGFYSFREAGFL